MSNPTKQTVSKLTAEDISKIMVSIGAPTEGLGSDVASGLIQDLQAAEAAKLKEYFTQAATQLIAAKKALADFRRANEKKEAEYIAAIARASGLVEKVLKNDRETVESFYSELGAARDSVPPNSTSIPIAPSHLPSGIGASGMVRSTCTRSCLHRAG